jgi:hypothetical protein
LGQWLTAVLSMKGESDQMTVPAAVELIRATPPGFRPRDLEQTPGTAIQLLLDLNGFDVLCQVPNSELCTGDVSAVHLSKDSAPGRHILRPVRSDTEVPVD